MCSGRVHTIINFTAIAVATPLLLHTSSYQPSWILTAAASAAFGTIFLSPDLDLKHSRSTRAWGWLSWLWCGYHRIFSHRQSSHAVILGTVTRLCYLAAVATLFLVAFHAVRFRIDSMDRQAFHSTFEAVSAFVEQTIPWLRENAAVGLACLVGLSIADSLHIGADLAYSWCRRRRLIS